MATTQIKVYPPSAQTTSTRTRGAAAISDEQKQNQPQDSEKVMVRRVHCITAGTVQLVFARFLRERIFAIDKSNIKKIITTSWAYSIRLLRGLYFIGWFLLMTAFPIDVFLNGSMPFLQSFFTGAKNREI